MRPISKIYVLAFENCSSLVYLYCQNFVIKDTFYLGLTSPICCFANKLRLSSPSYIARISYLAEWIFSLFKRSPKDWTCIYSNLFKLYMCRSEWDCRDIWMTWPKNSAKQIQISLHGPKQIGMSGEDMILKQIGKKQRLPECSMKHINNAAEKHGTFSVSEKIWNPVRYLATLRYILFIDDYVSADNWHRLGPLCHFCFYAPLILCVSINKISENFWILYAVIYQANDIRFAQFCKFAWIFNVGALLDSKLDF